MTKELIGRDDGDGGTTSVLGVRSATGAHRAHADRRPPVERQLDRAGRPQPVVRFGPADLQRACNRLSAGDRLHRLLARVGGAEARDCRLPMPARFAAPGFRRRHRGTLAVIGLYAALAVAPGLVISLLGPGLTDRAFIKLYDWQELPGALFLYLVLAPVLWTFYLWQPRLIVEVFDGLSRSSVIGPPRATGVTPDGFLQGMGATLPRVLRLGGVLRSSRGGLLSVLAAAAAVATLVVWPPTAVWPFDAFLPESDRYWWAAVPAYFWVVWLPLVFVNVYMLVWIVLRQAIMIANIQRLLRLFAVEPIPFHPDRCSGFAPIGGYALNIVRVALVVGGWALVLLVSGVATGHGLYVAPHTLFLVVVQVLLTPYLLLGPVWYAHRVMGAARDRALEGVAGRIRACLLGGSGAHWAPRDLATEYELTERGYHSWPFPPRALGGISVTAGLTLLANVASLLYRMR